MLPFRMRTHCLVPALFGRPSVVTTVDGHTWATSVWRDKDRWVAPSGAGEGWAGRTSPSFEDAVACVDPGAVAAGAVPNEGSARVAPKPVVTVPAAADAVVTPPAVDGEDCAVAGVAPTRCVVGIIVAWLPRLSTAAWGRGWPSAGAEPVRNGRIRSHR